MGAGKLSFEKLKISAWQHVKPATMSSRREAAAADAAGRPGCNGGAGGKGTKKYRKTVSKNKKKRLGQRVKLARMSSHGEAAAADAAGRPGCSGGEALKRRKLKLGRQEACEDEQP